VDELAAIRRLYSQYSWIMDERRFDEWLKLFTEDGAVEGPVFGRHSGPEGLRQFINRYKAETEMFQVRHVINNLEVEIQGDSATARCYSLHYRTHRGRTELNAIGTFHDCLRKVNGRWLFAERKVCWDYSGKPA
jgi:3-phenylpropionate/cinnamic acid dioxygenase small subunit